MAVIVVQASGLGPLMAGVGSTTWLAAGLPATGRSAIALAAITMPAEEEGGVAIRAAAADGQQDDRFWVRHVQAAAALDNGKPFLSP